MAAWRCDAEKCLKIGVLRMWIVIDSGVVFAVPFEDT